MPFRNPWYSANNNYVRVRNAVAKLQASPNNANAQAALQTLVVKLAKGNHVNAGSNLGGAAANNGRGGNATGNVRTNNGGAGRAGFFRFRNKAGSSVGKVNVNGTPRNVTRALNGTYYAANGNKFIKVTPSGILGRFGGRKFTRGTNVGVYSLLPNGRYQLNLGASGGTAVGPGLQAKVKGTNRNVYASNGKYFATKNGQANTNYYLVKRNANNTYNYNTNSKNIYNRKNLGNNKVGFARRQEPGLQAKVKDTNRNVYASNGRYFATKNGQPNKNYYLVKRNANNTYNYNTNSKNIYNRMNLGNKVGFARRQEPLTLPAPPTANNTKNVISNFILAGREVHKNALGPNQMNRIAQNYLTATRNGGTPPGWNGITSLNWNKLRTGVKNSNTAHANAHKNFWNAVNKLRREATNANVAAEGAYPLPNIPSSN